MGSPEGGLRVNVGCGATPTPGWLNFDNSPSTRLAAAPWLWPLLPASNRRLAEAARRHGVRRAQAMRLPLASGAAEVVYSSHMLEHLDRRDAEAFLKEAWRVLRPGGVLRLAVPNLRLHVETYIAGGDAEAFLESIYMGAERPRSPIQRMMSAILGPRHHLWMYDAASLSKRVQAAGFVDPTVLSPGETTIANPGPLDLRERAEESVYLEAKRP